MSYIRKFRMMMLAAVFAAPAYAQDTHCEIAQARELASLSDLPAQVQDLLGRSVVGTGGISDIGGKFSVSDAIVDSSIPMRRLKSGQVGADCIHLAIERGGIGYSVQQAEYQLVDGAWVQIAGKRLKQAPPLAPTAGTRPAAAPPR
jgi:hypothetical protein